MNGANLGSGRSVRLGAVIAVAAISLLGAGGSAQTPVSDAEDAPHPAHIHAGTCDQLGDVVVPLADVAYVEGEQAGASSATPLKLSFNLIDMPLQDLLAGEYAVNIHESADEIGSYIACGDVGGVITPGERGDDEVRFVVNELNESGHTGVVFLGVEGDQTELNVMVIELDQGS